MYEAKIYKLQHVWNWHVCGKNISNFDEQIEYWISIMCWTFQDTEELS